MTSPGRQPAPFADPGPEPPALDYYVSDALPDTQALLEEAPTLEHPVVRAPPVAAIPAARTGPVPKPTGGRGDKAKRLPGLDGLRALAVLAVMLFHLDPTLLPGGFLGVDLFFVISGYLITRLLLTEMNQLGRLRLARFYGRRVRRLFPAVAALLIAVSLASIFVWRDELATLRGSVLSSLTYVTNWWLIGAHQSYFVSTGRPPMLQHLWSLAIEEQYYLFWPGLIMLVTGLVWGRTRSSRSRAIPVQRVAFLALALAVTSTVVMAVIAIVDNVPYESDSSRVYFGTDTHSMGLFLGSAVGAYSVLVMGRSKTARSAAQTTAIRLFADVVAAACLTYVIWKFVNQSEYTPSLYRGGFLVFDAFAVVVIWVVVSEGSRLGWLLERPILRGIGQRSYSIYLWHWPVAVVTRPGIDVHGSIWIIQLARIGLILLLAEASYRLVERPLRAGHWRLPKPPNVPRSAEDLRLIMGAVAGVTCLAVLVGASQSGAAAGPAGAGGKPYIPPALHPTPQATAAPPATGPTTARQTTQPSVRATVAPPVTTRSPVATTSAPPAAVAPPAASAAKPYISAFGDSVLLGAQPALEALDPHVGVDAVEGRQAYIVLDAIVAAHQAGQLGPVVEIHIGNNGVINPSQLSNVLELLRDRHRVIVLNDHVPRDWEGINNQNVASVASHFSNVTFINWNSIADANPGWFYNDGLHLNPSGAAGYAQLILKAATS